MKQLIKETDVILDRAKDYYKNDKERLRDNARDKYRNLSEEEKNKKREYGINRYHNISEKKKKQLRECQKIVVKLIKAESLNSIKSYVSMHCLSSIMS